jgi:CRISPR-associated protein Cst2
MKTRGITATIIFESSAVNRDDKLGGNITSIKKMVRPDGVYSYMSRAFIRHHLFSTLYQQFDWQPAPVKAKEVIQFDFPRANIIDYPEMDFFGFMSTVERPKTAKESKNVTEESSAVSSSAGAAVSEQEKGLSLVRKAPLGITKAISLEPWQADMSFNANHNLVERALAQGLSQEEKAVPNPFQKEEHHSLYRVSFTLDLCRTGLSVHYFKRLPKDVEKWIDQYTLESTRDEVSANAVVEADADENGTWRKTCDHENKVKGFIGVYSNRLVFVVEKNERLERIQNLLFVLKNGLSIHSSTESYGLVPKFLVMATLSLPIPVFHGSFEIKNRKIDFGQLEYALSNNYVQKAWYRGTQDIHFAADKLAELEDIQDVMTSLE